MADRERERDERYLFKKTAILVVSVSRPNEQIRTWDLNVLQYAIVYGVSLLFSNIASYSRCAQRSFQRIGSNNSDRYYRLLNGRARLNP